MLNIRIRKAVNQDIPDIVNLQSILFSIEKDFQIDSGKQRNGVDLILQTPDRAVILIAQTDKHIIGMVSGQLVISTAAGAYSVLLEDMVIMPEFRGKGVGKKLVEALVIWAEEKGALRIQLAADERNTQALEFYRKEGFSESHMKMLYRSL